MLLWLNVPRDCLAVSARSIPPFNQRSPMNRIRSGAEMDEWNTPRSKQPT